MPFLKKTILWAVFLAAMYFGGSGAQSLSNFAQGMGFFSMLVACVCLYLVIKMIWGPLDNLSRLLLIGGVGCYIAFSIGLFNGNSLRSFLSGANNGISVNSEQFNHSGVQVYGGNNIPYSPSGNTGSEGIIAKVGKLFGGSSQPQAEISIKEEDLQKYPKMSGHPKVIRGNVLQLGEMKIRLFGIDAPDPTQTCANKYGNSYICGKEAIIWMRDRLNHKNVECYLINQLDYERSVGICFEGEEHTDVAAEVVNAGWAVAYEKEARDYMADEYDAAVNKRGLWSGMFYKPWDWRKIQQRKIDIKMPKNFTGFRFKGLFK